MGSAQELAEATLRLLQGHYDYVDRPPWKAAPSTRPRQRPVGESTVKAPPLTPPCLGALEAPPRRVPRVLPAEAILIASGGEEMSVATGGVIVVPVSDGE